MSLRSARQRRVAAVLGVLAGAGMISACAGEGGMRCEGGDQYVTSASAPPVRVPEGLSLPGEDDALTVPPRSVTDSNADAEERERCLAEPPEYFEGGEPQGSGE